MARLFRWVDKKRGDRRTVSTLAGRIGEAAFFGVLFLLGAAGLSNIVIGELLNPSDAPRVLGLGFWLLILVTSSFVLIGGGGVVWAVLHSRTSAERRSAIATKAARIDLISEAVPMPLEYPALPSDGNLTNSPGIVLAYRLPTVESPAWGILAAALFCLTWNGVTAVFTVWAIRAWNAGRPEWFLMMLLVPSCAVGGWAIYYFLKQLLVHTSLGPTIVEISNHPLYPGGRYDMLLSQTGRLRMRSLEVHLVCEEEVTYHQGTDIRHEIRSVYRLQIFRQMDFRIEPGSTFEASLEFAIPEEAMHSFQSGHSAVAWKLAVSGEAEGWPAFVRSFPIIVYPLRQTSQRSVEPRSTDRRPVILDDSVNTVRVPHGVGA